MGMVCVFRRASDHELSLLLRQPEWIIPYLQGDEFAAAHTARKPGFLARLLGRKVAPPPPAPPPWDAREDDDELDVDKAWHGLHYLFTGTYGDGEEPATYIMSGGELIGSVDVGYGAARAIRSAGVRSFDDFLSALDRDELLRRFDPARMHALDIYPRMWDREDPDEAFEYLWEYFQELRQFVARAARRSDGMIVYLS
jgi:hypothetical protein